jgi:hypothetical protein
MTQEEQYELLSETINMVMKCLEYYEDEQVKTVCRDFLNAFAYDEDESAI